MIDKDRIAFLNRQIKRIADERKALLIEQREYRIELNELRGV